MHVLCPCLLLTRNVETMTRMTFSLMADLAISTNWGMTSYFLYHDKKKLESLMSKCIPTDHSSPGTIPVEFLSDLCVEGQDPEAVNDLILHLRRRRVNLENPGQSIHSLRGVPVHGTNIALSEDRLQHLDSQINNSWVLALKLCSGPAEQFLSGLGAGLVAGAKKSRQDLAGFQWHKVVLATQAPNSQYGKLRFNFLIQVFVLNEYPVSIVTSACLTPWEILT